MVAEFLVWGSGWMVWRKWVRGIVMLALWGLWIVMLFFAIPAIATGLVVVPIAAPAFLVASEMVTITIGLYTGLRSAGSLTKKLEKIEAPASITA